MSCLARLSQQKHISRTQEPESTPTRGAPFPEPHHPVARDSRSCFFLRFQARCQHLLGHSPITGERSSWARISVQLMLRLTMMCKTFEMVVRIMPPHLVPLVCSSQLVTTLVMSCKGYEMLEQSACLLPNARSEGSVLFHAVSLRGLSRFRLCLLGGWLFRRLGQSMHTPSAAQSVI